MKKMAAVLFVLIALAAAVFFFHLNRSPGLIPRELLFGSPEKAAPQLSPDGSLVAYLAPDQGVLNVWILDRKTKKERVLTRDRDRGIRHYTWAPDGREIFFLQDRGGNEDWHLYKMSVAGGPATDLTPFEGVQARVLAIDKHYPDQILLVLNKEDKSRHDVYRLNLKSGELSLAAKNPGQASGWVVDPEMKVRGAVVTRPEGGYEVLIREGEDREWKKIFSWDFEDSMASSVAGFSKTGNEVFLLDPRGRDTAALVKWDVRTGEKEVLAADPHYDVAGVALNPDDHEPEMAFLYRTRNEWVPLRESARKDLEILRKIREGDFDLVSRSDDDRYWIVRFEDDVTPVKYYIYDRKTGRHEFLFCHQPKLSKYRFSKREAVTIPSRDGLILTGYKTLPRGGHGPFPTVILVHGGPWSRDTWGYDPVPTWLADRGYACLQVNFRGSAGFGKDFVNLGNKEWGRKMQTDLLDAVDWAVREGFADPKRVGIFGASYGGYAVLAAAAFTPESFRCGIDLFGPSDLISLARSMPPYWSVEKANILRRLGDPDTDAAFLRERSPLYQADNIRFPLLIAQGANDPRTKRSESDRIVSALRKRDIECEYLVFDDEGHGFAKPQNRLQFFKAAEAFLAKHLGGRYEP